MSSRALPDDLNTSGSSEQSHRKMEHDALSLHSITTLEKVAGFPSEVQSILRQATQKTGATGAAIALRVGSVVSCQVSSGAPAPEVGTRVQPGIGLAGLCLTSGKILYCNDTDSDRRVDARLCKEMGVRSLMVLPIRRNTEVVGVLQVLSGNTYTFNKHAAIAMSEFANRELRLSSESVDRCLAKFSRDDVAAVQDPQKLLIQDNEYERVPKDTSDEATPSKRHPLESQLDQPMTLPSQEHRTGARWLKLALVAALALAIDFIYGHHLPHRKLATVGPVPVVAEHYNQAIEDHNMLSEQHEKTNTTSNGSNSVLTASRSATIEEIQRGVQGKEVNGSARSAKADNSRSQYETGLRYADGKGVPQNDQEAMRWFEKAAENGNTDAQWKLGLGYMKGIGVPRDERKAALWFKRAANNRDVRAQNAMSDLYLNGRGVQKDYVRAYTWASIATGLRGNTNDRLMLLESRMTAAQIEDAHQRISNWEQQEVKSGSTAGSQKFPHESPQ